MKLRKEDITRSQDASPLHLFRQGIRAETTLRRYNRVLRLVLCDVLEDVFDGDFEWRAAQFVQRGRDEPDWMLDLLLSLSSKLRERTKLPKNHDDYLNPTSVPLYFQPIKKLLDMNSVSVVWRRVYATFPEKDNILDVRGWSRDEIVAMLRYIRHPLDRALVLLLASSGMRIGGLDLKWGDITPIYKKNGHLTTNPGEYGDIACAAVDVYTGSPEAYTTFVTPEAYQSIMEYGQMWADVMMRQPGPDDPLFLTTKMPLHKMAVSALQARIYRMVVKAGLREQPGKNGARYQTQLVHGFRKFFNKACRETLSGNSLGSLIRAEYMMGHKGLVALDKNYFSTDTLEMAAEYVRVVPALTINDAEQLGCSNSAISKNTPDMTNEVHVHPVFG